MYMVFILLILFQVSLDSVSSHPCPPSCHSKQSLNLCRHYVQSAGCVDISGERKTTAQCGCMWQNYIQSVGTSNANNNHCLRWAVMECATIENTSAKEETFIEKKVLLSSVTAPLIDIVKSILKVTNQSPSGNTPRYTKTGEIAKSRKRNGVTFERRLPKRLPPPTRQPVSESLISRLLKERNAPTTSPKPKKIVIGTVEEITERPPIKRIVAAINAPVTKKLDPVKKPFKEWMDVKMPADQFKLMVFAVILILNILVVLVLILRRTNESKERVRDSRPLGDLNLSIYKNVPPKDDPNEPKTEEESPKTTGRWNKIVDKAKQVIQERADKKRREEAPFLFNTDEEVANSKTAHGWDMIVQKTRQSIQEHKDQKRRDESPFLYMNELHPDDFPDKHTQVLTSSPYVNTSLRQSPHRASQRESQRYSRGLYESIDDDDDSFCLDNTYEEVPPPVSPILQKLRTSSMKYNQADASPTKFFPRYAAEDNKKGVSFTIPSDDSVPGEEAAEKASRRISGGSTENGTSP